MKLDAVGDEKFKGCGVLICEGTHQVPIAVSAFAVVVADPVLKNLVCRILDSMLTLSTGSATKVDISAAHHSVSTDVKVLLDHDHGGAVVECGNGCCES